MSRFPVIPPDQQTAEQSLVEPSARRIFSHLPPEVQWQGSSGVILGPYSPLYYTPSIIKPWFSFAYSIGSQPHVTAREKELAILATLAEHRAPYVQYAHSHSARAAGFSQEQIAQALQGQHQQPPAGLSDAEQAAYMAALAMARSRGPISTEDFKTAVAALGREKVAELAHVVGGYMYVCLLSNLANEEVPDGGVVGEEDGRVDE
ncbi:carboxymuconolactone decarboxylase family protein [Aspergillus vadensis CBS 113365]|uniref:Carboxymuconolactone decarboxylase-like domain-containing protein n=1 Tax=Aspergillus vadensis (strain CBS 113365 / IMI 142717 / IBT 24658) TaxID=1448311 RepID=A0A319BVB8_ASPVC|nr:hypothetical protein BO88DRAFT_386656 [Aspergillus vadensis CBS 113365]PYH69783.1 hypothetical protein BO88DRAFT_386656 [Aspergillus vadensis CBS 113365]